MKEDCWYSQRNPASLLLNHFVPSVKISVENAFYLQLEPTSRGCHWFSCSAEPGFLPAGLKHLAARRACSQSWALWAHPAGTSWGWPQPKVTPWLLWHLQALVVTTPWICVEQGVLSNNSCALLCQAVPLLSSCPCVPLGLPDVHFKVFWPFTCLVPTMICPKEKYWSLPCLCTVFVLLLPHRRSGKSRNKNFFLLFCPGMDNWD